MIRKTRGRHDAVELNLAAMLDMAFQLLTFFILTFRPAPVENQIALRMPAPKPLPPIISSDAPPGDQVVPKPTEGFDALKITLIAGSGGALDQIHIDWRDVPVDRQLAGLDRALRDVLKDPANPFEQVIVQVDSRLHYDQLMRVMDVCSHQTIGGNPPKKLTKLSLVDSNDR